MSVFFLPDTPLGQGWLLYSELVACAGWLSWAIWSKKELGGRG